MSRVWAFVVFLHCLLPLPLAPLLSLSLYLFSVLFINFHVVGTAEDWNHCTHAQRGVLLRGDTKPYYRLWAQPPWQLRLLRDFCSDLPGWIWRHRYGAFVLVRCGTRRWAYQKSAIFTTVHSGARRISELVTNLSLSWRKFVASLALSHTHKYGETRIRTKFVSKTEIKSRPGKRANQDSPWKTKRANSCWSQIWDPEAPTWSRFWQKKYPASNWNYWFSEKWNWSYSCMWWKTSRRSTTPPRTTTRTKSGSSQNSYQKSSCDGRIEESSRVTNRWIFEKKIDRKSGHYQWTHGQNSGTTEWSQLYELLESFLSGLSHVPSQLALFPSYRDPGGLLSRNDKPPDIWNAHGFSGNVFANPTASSSALYPQESNPWISNVMEDTLVLTSTEQPVTCGERQIPDTVLTPRFQPGLSAENSFDPKEGRSSKDYGADQQRLQISELHFDKIPYPNNICLLKDKIQNWGMYLFTISDRSYAMDQRSGDGWFSGWFKIFVICKRNSSARLWIARRENCFSTEQDHPEYPLQEKGQSGENESSQRKPFLSRKTGRLPDLQVLPGHWSQRFCRELCRPIYNCSSKWCYSGILF